MNAIATRTERTVTETVTIEKKVPVITLELSLEQAITLRTIGNAVGGSPTTTIRGHMAAINEALDAANVRPIGWSKVVMQPGMNSIYFNDDSLEAMKKAVEQATTVTPPAPAVRRVGVYKTDNGYQSWNGTFWGQYAGTVEAARRYCDKQTSYPPRKFDFVSE